MNSFLAFFLSFGAPEAPVPAQDMQFLKTPSQLEAFCARRYTFEGEVQACLDKALIIGLEKTQACSNFSRVSIDRESCLNSAGEGTSVEVLRYCGSHEFSMNKIECLKSGAKEALSAEYQVQLLKKPRL